MDSFKETRIRDTIHELASASGDSLRSAQRAFAQLIDSGDQEAAISYAISTFLALNPPQRIQVLMEIQLHLAQGRYPCLAFGSNGRFFEHVMGRLMTEVAREQEVSDDTLWRWFRRIHSEIRKTPVHGSPEHIQEVSGLIDDIRTAALNVSVEQHELRISLEFNGFLETLTDNELGRLTLFVRRIRDIRSCRDRFREVADERYIRQELGLQPSDSDEIFDAFGSRPLNLTADFHAYLRAAPAVVAEIARMDFTELTLLMDHLSDFRSRKFNQGRVR